MIAPGTTVEVTPPPGPPNPWIDQKLGWIGTVLCELADMPGHVRVRFDPQGQRIMPVSALRVVPDPVGAAPCGRPLPATPQPAVDAKAGQPRGVAPTERPAAIPVAKPEPLVIPPNAPTVRVRDTAGSGDGEDHIRRRRGQIGRVIADGEVATGFRYVAFPPSPLWVLIPSTSLVPVTARPKIKTTMRQLGLVM